MRLAYVVLGFLFLFPYAYAHDAMHPELDRWYESLEIPGPEMQGASCCDKHDCKPVKARMKNDHWEVWIDSKTFPDDPAYSDYVGHAPNAWVPVPENAIIRDKANLAGEAVACWYNKTVRCFVPPAGV